ncbi:MAG TPA: hypothetical protein VMW27_24425 [Thermoanaerobaculia bacterium]|nr:hypothetical protein [Thermoanaerobaculia bacterium]
MIRIAPIVCLLLLALGAAAAAAQEDTESAPASGPVATELRLERKLLSLDLASYTQARQREDETRTRVAEVTTRLDEALNGDALSLGDLEALRGDLDTAREAARTAAARVDMQIQKLEERLQRIGFLEGETGGAGAAPETDPLTGRWRVRILPQDQTGFFDLSLSGSVVTGTYQMEGVGLSTSGSLRGTLTGNVLRLERIDSRRGFDATFDGTIGTSGAFITGSWTANELAAGEAARGGWSAIRISRTSQEEQEP